jgi:hypothetical protein
MVSVTRSAHRTCSIRPSVALVLASLCAALGAACGGSRAHGSDGGPDAAADALPILTGDDDGGDARDGRAHPDAPVDAGACWESAECTTPAVCLAPGEESCAPCPTPTADCSSDSACADDGPTWICEPVACGCYHTCVPGCTSDSSCPAWMVCGADHRCGPKSCGGDAGLCPANFSCEVGHCARRRCSEDADCAGACVKSLCYDRPGVCTAPTGP